MWVTRDKDGGLYAWNGKPEKEYYIDNDGNPSGGWRCCGRYDGLWLNSYTENEKWKNVRWEDEEPTRLTDGLEIEE